MSQATSSSAGPCPPESAPLADRMGMWVFIGTEILFFGGLLFAYALARAGHPAGFALASRHTEVVIGTLNTALLLTSSAAIAVAAEASRLSARGATRLALWAALCLGGAFLVLKGVEYAMDWRHGLVPGSAFALGDDEATRRGAELFYTLYYLMTALHALHLAIGLAAMGWLLRGVRRDGVAQNAPWADRIEIVALYWHFVDVVWILLYPLLYLIDRS